MPQVSVILTVYNNKEDIEEAIKSVLAQTYKDWELIIVDDGSTDDLYPVIKKYIDNEKVLFIKNEVNLGRYVSLNIGIIKTRGIYIALIDSDDTYHPSKIEKQVKIFENNPNTVVVTTIAKRENLVRSMPPASMWRKAIHEKIGYFDSVLFGADSEFFERINAVYGAKSTHAVKEILYFSKRRQNSLTTNSITGSISTRKYYVNRFNAWHRTDKDKLYMPFPLLKRPFVVDASMLKKS